MKMVKDEYPDKPLELFGALGKRNHYQQFQPVVTLRKGYTMHWDQAAPAEVTIWLINFNRSVTDQLCNSLDSFHSGSSLFVDKIHCKSIIFHN